jgi:hypothetical protein
LAVNHENNVSLQVDRENNVHLQDDFNLHARAPDYGRWFEVKVLMSRMFPTLELAILGAEHERVEMLKGEQ